MRTKGTDFISLTRRITLMLMHMIMLCYDFIVRIINAQHKTNGLVRGNKNVFFELMIHIVCKH